MRSLRSLVNKSKDGPAPGWYRTNIGHRANTLFSLHGSEYSMYTCM
jgi:hypothetical protein